MTGRHKVLTSWKKDYITVQGVEFGWNHWSILVTPLDTLNINTVIIFMAPRKPLLYLGVEFDEDIF